MDGLAEDADLSIEELMRKYGVGREENGVEGGEDEETSPVEIGGEEQVEEDGEESAVEEEESAAEEEEEATSVVGETKVAHLRPPFLLRGSLRPYQQAGLEWLASLYSSGVNGSASFPLVNPCANC